MTQPETKTVLGRVFTKRGKDTWACITQSGSLTLYYNKNSDKWFASLTDSPECSPRCACALERTGHNEDDAISALQAALRKMAELKVM